jgi:hypothetical protein
VLFLGTTAPNEVDVLFRNGVSLLGEQKENVVASFYQLGVGIFFEDELDDVVFVDPLRKALDGEEPRILKTRFVVLLRVLHSLNCVDDLILDELEFLHALDPHLEERALQVALCYLQLIDFLHFVAIDVLREQALVVGDVSHDGLDLLEVHLFHLHVREVAWLKSFFC